MTADNTTNCTAILVEFVTRSQTQMLPDGVSGLTHPKSLTQVSAFGREQLCGWEGWDATHLARSL
jgi:hypothetical protein